VADAAEVFRLAGRPDRDLTRELSAEMLRLAGD
jgi:hypothetical protein